MMACGRGRDLRRTNANPRPRGAKASPASQARLLPRSRKAGNAPVSKTAFVRAREFTSPPRHPRFNLSHGPPATTRGHAEPPTQVPGAPYQ